MEREGGRGGRMAGRGGSSVNNEGEVKGIGGAEGGGIKGLVVLRYIWSISKKYKYYIFFTFINHSTFF